MNFTMWMPHLCDCGGNLAHLTCLMFVTSVHATKRWNASDGDPPLSPAALVSVNKQLSLSLSVSLSLSSVSLSLSLFLSFSLFLSLSLCLFLSCLS